jgi:hypothetical protein
MTAQEAIAKLQAFGKKAEPTIKEVVKEVEAIAPAGVVEKALEATEYKTPNVTRVDVPSLAPIHKAQITLSNGKVLTVTVSE